MTQQTTTAKDNPMELNQSTTRNEDDVPVSSDAVDSTSTASSDSGEKTGSSHHSSRRHSRSKSRSRSRSSSKSSSSSSKKKRGKSYKSLKNRTRILLVATVSMAIILVITLFTLGVNLVLATRENNVLEAKLKVTNSEMAGMETELAALKEEKNKLLRGILPNLSPLTLDQVIDLNDGYLKNITFSYKKVKNVSGYEYKLVLQNNLLTSIFPEVSLFFFTKDGIQQGLSEIGGTDENAIKANALGPAETTSYSAFIPFTSNKNKPEYYMIERSRHSLEEMSGK